MVAHRQVYSHFAKSTPVSARVGTDDHTIDRISGWSVDGPEVLKLDRQINKQTVAAESRWRIGFDSFVCDRLSYS
jgi:hypothetical protein